MYGVMLVRDLLDRRTGTISLITGLIRVQHLMGATSQTLARHLINPLHMVVVGIMEDIMDGTLVAGIIVGTLVAGIMEETLVGETLVAGIIEVDVILQRE